MKSVALILYSVLSILGYIQKIKSTARHARVELLSRQTAIALGSELQLGIHFILEPGWHIYWINPGDSGQPPIFKWQMPEGFTPGNITCCRNSTVTFIELSAGDFRRSFFCRFAPRRSTGLLPA